MPSQQRTITVEDLYKLTPTNHPRISPDGKRIAFVVTSIDEHKLDYRSSIWIVPTAGGEAQQFTSGAANAGSPSWSPDGAYIGFFANGKLQKISIAGGAPQAMR